MVTLETNIMVEVFKTNVKDPVQANMLLDQIHKTFTHYNANFDLDDCDHILRVKSVTDLIDCSFLIDMLRASGYQAEVLQD